MHTALEVANWFLNYNDEKMYSDGADYISNLKLQKLLYYAQGTFLAITNSPLFGDAIEAWMHGPVVPSVYHAYKKTEIMESNRLIILTPVFSLTKKLSFLLRYMMNLVNTQLGNCGI